MIWGLKRRGHWSDCAIYNAPAYEPGPCDCGGLDLAAYERYRRETGLMPTADGLSAFLRMKGKQEGWYIRWLALLVIHILLVIVCVSFTRAELVTEEYVEMLHGSFSTLAFLWAAKLLKTGA
jgi:hypothetical protein